MGLGKILSVGIKKGTTFFQNSGKYGFWDDLIRTAQSKGTIQKISLAKADDLFEPLLSKMDFSENCTTYISDFISAHGGSCKKYFSVNMPNGDTIWSSFPVSNPSSSWLQRINGKLDGVFQHLAKKGLIKRKTENFIPLEFARGESITEIQTIAKKLGIEVVIPRKGYSSDDISILNDALDSMRKLQNANSGRILLPRKLGLESMAQNIGGYTNYDNIFINRYSRMNMDDIVFHELGHLNHTIRINPMTIAAQGDLKKFGYNSRITDEFLNNSDLQATIKKELGIYAKYSPAEFVAEVYKKLAKGEPVSDTLLTRYKMYNGPEIPKTFFRL